MSQVRRAKPSDAAQLVDLRRQMFSDIGSLNGNGQWEAAARDWFDWAIEHNDIYIAVIAEGKQLLACGVGVLMPGAPGPKNFTGQKVHVFQMVTMPEARRRGYGRRCLDALMEWGRDRGAGQLELLASDDGLPLYEKAGMTMLRYPMMRSALS